MLNPLLCDLSEFGGPCRPNKGGGGKEREESGPSCTDV